LAALRAASETGLVEVEPMPEFTDPSDLPGRITDYQGIWQYCLRDHSSCADKGKLTDIMTTNNGGICTNASTSPDIGFGIIATPVDGAPGVYNVSKNHGWTKEHIVITGNTFINRYIVLDFNVTAQDYPRRYNHVLSYITFLSYLTACHDMTKVPNLRAAAYYGTLICDSGMMDKIIVISHFEKIL
jgi:hypothetical protein